jgi:saccharopine dehydrogenase (NAD+, L-lysine-forming)
MENKTIFILGGYGNTGRPLARLLLQESAARLVLAGRNLDKAQGLAEELNRTYGGDRVRGACVDASDLTSLRQAFRGVDFVVVASSTTQFTRQIASAALESRIGYLDIQYSTQKIALLNSMAPAIQQAGCVFITDGGFHPGLPALMVRYVSQFFDRLLSARVGSVIKEDWNRLEVEDSQIWKLEESKLDQHVRLHQHGLRWRFW